MASHFRTLLVMLTKWTRQPWTSSFNHHTLALHLILESTTLLQLTCYANSRILWVAYIPNILYQVAECLEWNAMHDSMIIFLVSQLVHNSKEKGELHWWQWNKKIQCSYQCLDREDRQAFIGAAYEFSCTFLVKFLILGMGEQFKMW